MSSSEDISTSCFNECTELVKSIIPTLSARLCPKRNISPTTPPPINKVSTPADDIQHSQPGSQRERDQVLTNWRPSSGCRNTTSSLRDFSRNSYDMIEILDANNNMPGRDKNNEKNSRKNSEKSKPTTSDSDQDNETTENATGGGSECCELVLGHLFNCLFI